ncbi:uncharacterized protein LOC119647575 [Hermetia illucens]|uniref:uncharacterized protein LOC119647575 n=1 Tax=Hermetia illucens TaxID=343691 RepID=UPI0018CC1A8F|nr:uncharacterized protein LOC119647575 [Hermetia illucens]
MPISESKKCGCKPGSQVPDPVDCRKFYVCTRGNYIHSTCRRPSGYFSSRSRRCVELSQSDCNLKTRKGRDSYSPECVDGERIMDPESSGGFYLCEWGVNVRYECPSRHHFSKKMGRCVRSA